MANRNIDESIRKPRRTKGTPFYRQRDYFAIGIIAFGGLCWYLYELWPQSQKLKKSLLEGKFADSEALKERTAKIQLTQTSPVYASLVKKLEDRAIAREDALYEDTTKPQPWYSRIFNNPEI